MAYQLKYDSVHNRIENVSYTDDSLILNGKTVKIFKHQEPGQANWNSVGVDVLCESTGVFLTTETATAHLNAGAKKVILSAPSKDDTPMFV